MDTSRNDQLGELAADASLERSDFLVQASAQLRKFLQGNAERIADLGGLVLIDDEVDYLAVAADLTFRSRSRYLDEATGKWVSETEVIENPSELIELYNLADIFASFEEATKSEAGLGEEPTAVGDLLKSADIAPEETVALGAENPYAEAADEWPRAASTKRLRRARRRRPSGSTTWPSPSRSAASRPRLISWSSSSPRHRV